MATFNFPHHWAIVAVLFLVILYAAREVFFPLSTNSNEIICHTAGKHLSHLRNTTDDPVAIPIDSSASISSGVTGKIFQGNKILNYTGPKYFNAYTTRDLHSVTVSYIYKDRKHRRLANIAHWAVVTTIHAPSDAIIQLSQNHNWGLVIVGDKGAKPFKLENTTTTTVYLDVEEQEKLALENPELFKLLPWKHFGRKNIGYLYAILQGAKQIWDFDDDNPLKLTIKNPFIPSSDIYTIAFPPIKNTDDDDQLPSIIPSKCIAFNPYPYMGAPDKGAWPRGYPLNLIRQPCTHKFVPMNKKLINSEVTVPDLKVAVYQSLADNEPDVDGIFRLTRTTPFSFESTSTKTIVIPPGTFTPFNAQATLVLKPALWSLLLPVSVHGRVSDIWRSYFIQRLLWDIDYTIAFTPPQVNQFRNPHNPLGDMKAEDDLYYKSLALIQRLAEWKGTTNTLPGRYEELIIDLYERGYIGILDVQLVQQWLLTLDRYGYKFPILSNEPPVDIPYEEETNNEATNETNKSKPDDKEPENKEPVPTENNKPSETVVSTDIYSVLPSSSIPEPSTKEGGKGFKTKLSLGITIRSYYGRLLEIWTTLIPGYLIFYPWREWKNLDLIVVLDGDSASDHYAGVLLGNLPPYPKVVFEDFPPAGTLVNWGGRGIGYCRQQYSNFYSDYQTDADVIGMVDSDALFVSPVTPEYLFPDGKPIQIGIQLGETPGVVGVDWTLGVRLAIGTDRPLLRMVASAFPVLMKREHFPLLRAHMIKTTGTNTFEEAFYKVATGNAAFTTLCQFDIMVNYLWYFHRNEYSWHFKDAALNHVPYINAFNSLNDPELRETHHSPVMYISKNGGHTNFAFSFVADFVCLFSNFTSGSCPKEKLNGNFNSEWESSIINNLRMDTWVAPYRWKERGHHTDAAVFSNPIAIGVEDTLWDTPQQHWTVTWSKHLEIIRNFTSNTQTFQWAKYTSHSMRPWEGEHARRLSSSQDKHNTDHITNIKYNYDTTLHQLYKEQQYTEYRNRTYAICEYQS